MKINKETEKVMNEFLKLAGPLQTKVKAYMFDQLKGIPADLVEEVMLAVCSALCLDIMDQMGLNLQEMKMVFDKSTDLFWGIDSIQVDGNDINKSALN